MSQKNKLRILFSVIFVILACCIGGIYITLYMRSGVDPTPWRKETSPLSQEVIVDLCDKFTITSSDPLCALESPIFADQFFPIVRNKLKDEGATYYEVNEKLSQYEWKKYSIAVDNGRTGEYEVWYDLRGDRVTAIVITFSEQGHIVKIMDHLTYNDW